MSFEITSTPAPPRSSTADLGFTSSSPKWVWYALGAIGLGYYFFTIHAYNWKAVQRR